MAISKTSGALAAGLCLALCAGAITGGAFLRKRMDAYFNVDLAAEEQKCLFVGTYRKVEGFQVSVTVRMASPGRDPEVKALSPSDFSYDVGGQQDEATCWADLKGWAASVTGGARIDEWIASGGTLDFQSFCGSASSVRKQAKSGGGAYFVHEPGSDGSLALEYQPVVLQLAGEDISL